MLLSAGISTTPTCMPKYVATMNGRKSARASSLNPKTENLCIFSINPEPRILQEHHASHVMEAHQRLGHNLAHSAEAQEMPGEALNHQPSTINHQPSTINHQP
jgi:hypothetical protein